MLLTGLALVTALALATTPAAAGTTLVPVPGSPFADPGSGSMLDVAISPNGRFVASSDLNANAAAVYTLNATTGVLTSVPGSPFANGGTNPRSVAFSPNGSLLVEPSIDSNTIAVFSVNQNNGALASVAGSPFADSSSPTTATGPESAFFTPNGAYIAVAEAGGVSVSMFSVNSGTGALALTAGSPYPMPNNTVPADAVFNPTGTLLAVTLDGPGATGAPGNSVLMFQADESTGTLTQIGTSVATGDVNPGGLAFSPSGRFLAVANGGNGGGSVSVFSVGAGGTLAAVPGSPFSGQQGDPNSVTFSPDGTLLATASGDGVMPLYAVNQSTGVLTPVPGSPFSSVGGNPPLGDAFTPDGRFLIGGYNGGSGMAVDQVVNSIPPVLAKTFNAQAVSGRVLVKPPHAHAFTKLAQLTQLPNNTTVNATAGTVRIVTATTRKGQLQQALYSQGEFTLHQQHSSLALAELAKLACAGTHHGGRRAITARHHPHLHLWGNGHGHYGTSTHYATAITQGTEWLTDETCTGTRITVARGTVSVTDHVKHRTVAVHAGHSYLAGH